MDDFKVGSQIFLLFNTRDDAGNLVSFSGSPAVSVYKNNSTIQAMSGVALTVDFDGVAGLNLLVISTGPDAAFYSTGSTFHVVVTAGTAGGNSLVGEVFYKFSLGIVPSNVSEQIALDVFNQDRGWDDGLPAIQSGLATSAQLSLVAAYVDTEVASIKQTTDALWTMLVLDGSVYQFSTNALERGSGNSGAVAVLPLASHMMPRVRESKIIVYIEETLTVSTGVYDNDLNPVDLTGLSLQFSVETKSRINLLTRTTASSQIAVSGNTFTVTLPPSIAEQVGREMIWALRVVGDKNVKAYGTIEALYAAR